MKYILNKANGIIINIAKPIKEISLGNYSRAILESSLLTDEEMEVMTDLQIHEWIKENNKRMIAICKFLNEQTKK